MVSKNWGNNKTFGLLADTSQRNSTSFGTVLALVRMSMGGLWLHKHSYVRQNPIKPSWLQSYNSALVQVNHPDQCCVASQMNFFHFPEILIGVKKQLK